MKIDHRFSSKTIRRFSAKGQRLPPHVREELDKMFNFDQPDEFYAGLATGLGVAQILMGAGKAQLIPLLVAYLSTRMEQKEII